MGALLLSAGTIFAAYEYSKAQEAGAPYDLIGLGVGLTIGVALKASGHGGDRPILTAAGIGYALGEATRLIARTAREDAE